VYGCGCAIGYVAAFFLPYGGYTKIVHFMRTGLDCMYEWREGKDRIGATDIEGSEERSI